MKHDYKVYKLTLGNSCSLLIPVITLERIATFIMVSEVHSKKFIRVALRVRFRKIEFMRMNLIE